MRSDHDHRRLERRERLDEARLRRRGRRAPLTEAAIVAAALAIADAEGFAAVSMRRVAAALGVVPMALYHHVADKDDLVAMMADAISAEMVVPELPADWRGALRAISYRTRDTFLRHPWLVGASPQRHHLTANGLRHVEQSAQAVAGLDVDEATAIRMVAATDDFVIGYCVRQFSGQPDPDAVERELERFRPELERLLATGAYPRTAEFLARGKRLELPDDRFEIGLEWLLDGMAATLAARATA